MLKNIRNPVITHCYYGNLLLLSGLCFPSAFISYLFMCFCFCSFLLQPVFVSRFYNPYLVLHFFTNSLILVALRFAYRHLDPHLYLLSICLANNSLSDPINGMRTLFAPCVWSPLFLYPHFSIISSSWYAALDT